MQAMILAAGFGTRLKPYTLSKPKPLFPILNIPIILLTIKRLKASGCNRIIVNCHHLRDQFVELLEGIEGVVLQEEEIILGTGGGLRRAVKRLSDEPLLVTNGDIYHSVDLNDFYLHHLNSHNDVTLAVHDFPRFNSLTIKAEKIHSFDLMHEGETAAFTGLHVINPSLLENLTESGFSCIIDFYKELLNKKQPISIKKIEDHYWTDMGTPADYLLLHEGLLNNTIPLWPELQGLDCNKRFIDEGAKCGNNLVIDGWASIGKAEIGDDVRICRSIVWDGAVVPSGSTLKDTIYI